MARGPAGDLRLAATGAAGIPRASLKSSRSSAADGVGDGEVGKGGGEAVLLRGVEEPFHNSSCWCKSARGAEGTAGGHVDVGAWTATGGGTGKGGSSSMVAGACAISARVVFTAVRFEGARFLPVVCSALAAEDSAAFGG